jgi:hypothetical protein
VDVVLRFLHIKADKLEDKAKDSTKALLQRDKVSYVNTNNLLYTKGKFVLVKRLLDT